MKPTDAVKALDALGSGFEGPEHIPNEDDHKDADGILLAVLRELGHSDVADAYDRLNLRVDGFFYS